MHLQNHISEELWAVISKTYLAENYTHAIVDAMHFLTDVLRTRAGVDGDGVGMVGQALSGEQPRLRINKLQTQSERDEQKGFEQIIRGLYQGIRNPRSHDTNDDSKEHADAIIYFINYVAGVLERSALPFTIEGFLVQVYDDNFVCRERYAELLIDEIPIAKRADVLIELFRTDTGGGDNVKFFATRLYTELSVDDQAQVLAIFSTELRTTCDASRVRRVMQLLPPENWSKLHELGRLRAENMVYEWLKKAAITNDARLNHEAALLTWAFDFVPHFETQIRRWMEWEIASRLESNTAAAAFFMSRALPLVHAVVSSSASQLRVITTIKKKAEAGDASARSTLLAGPFLLDDNWKQAVTRVIGDISSWEQQFDDEEVPF